MSENTPQVAGLRVMDEGITVVNPATSMDFVGAGVVASNGGNGKATVTIAGGGGTTEVTNKVLTNNGDGTYTIPDTPVAGSVHVYKNGISQLPGAGNDYTLSGSTVTSLLTYDPNDVYTADYFK